MSVPTVPAPAIPLDVARHVLNWFGDTNLGLDGGTYVNRLLALVSCADEVHFEQLRTIEPTYVYAFEAVSRKPWGLEWLRGVVKADLDHTDLGLDFTAVSA